MCFHSCLLLCLESNVANVLTANVLKREEKRREEKRREEKRREEKRREEKRRGKKMNRFQISFSKCYSRFGRYWVKLLKCRAF